MDASDQYSWVDAEIAKRREVIAQQEREIDELVMLAKLSRKYRAETDSKQVTGAGAIQTVTASVTARPKPSKKDTIISTAIEILSDGIARGSRKLLAEFDKRGIEVGGKDPAMNLSSYLSREKEVFVASSSGYTLRSLQKERPGEVAASLGLGFNGSEATHHAVWARKEDAELG